MGIVSCKICQSTATTIFLSGETSLVKCANCGSVYNQHTSSEKETTYYKENYTLRKNSISLQSELRRMSRWPEQLKLIADIRKIKPESANIIDVGCDKGYFIDEARRFGYSVYGVELSKDARKYTEQLGLTVKDSVEELGVKADILTMWHSLEHFSEPLSFLKSLHPHLNSQAHLFIRVPDFGCFFSKVLKQKWRWFQPENHYFHYTQQSLTNLFQQAGFQVVQCRSQNPSNCLTDRSFSIANKTLRKYYNEPASLKYVLGTYYERITCKELYLIAKTS